MKRRRVLPVVFSLLMVLGVALPTQAAEPTSVGLWACHNGGGQWRVGRRSPVTLFYGWATNTRRQANRFLNRSYVEVTLDGAQLGDAESYWSDPEKVDPTDPESDWVTSWRYPLGRLGRGNSVDVTFQVIFTRAHFDGYFHFEPGPVHDPALECRVYTRS